MNIIKADYGYFDSSRNDSIALVLTLQQRSYWSKGPGAKTAKRKSCKHNRRYFLFNILLTRFILKFPSSSSRLKMDTQSYLPVQPGVGMEENFLSLDDILLSHERLPIRTECAFPRLGFLEKSSDTQDIPEVSNVKVTERKCTNRLDRYNVCNKCLKR